MSCQVKRTNVIPMSSARCNVLLVDDDPDSLRLVSYYLERAGFDVRTAKDGLQAIAAIEADCPDVVITDWQMPEITGLELCRWLRAQDLPHYVVVLFLTVRSATEDRVQALEAGADDFISKPVDRVELLARLRSAKRLLEMERRLRLSAKTDPLTGLATQPTLFEQLQKEWSRSKRYNLPLSCVILDVDYFKRINDNHGHPVGDEVLRRLADLLRTGCRHSDIVSRYGGEEFCVLLPETDESGAALWADRMRKKIAAATIQARGAELNVTCSFGVAQRLEDTQTPCELVDLADQALLTAKQTGRDRVVSFQSLAASRGEVPFDPDGPGSVFRGILARDAMTSIVAGLREEDTLVRAAQFFLDSRIGSAPVVSPEGTLTGILSEKDLLTVLVWPNWWEVKIRDVMKRNVVAYASDAPVRQIYEFLCRVSLRSVIITEDRRPVGVLSRASLLRWFTNAAEVHESSERIAELPSAQPSDEAVTAPLLAAAAMIRDEASQMEFRLKSGDSEILPCVVGGASRMQELVNDLLANARHVRPDSLEAMLLGMPSFSGFTEPAMSGIAAAAAMASQTKPAPLPAAPWFPPGCEPEVT